VSPVLSLGRGAQMAASLLIVGVLLVLVLPMVTGADWAAVGHAMQILSPMQVGLLLTVWLLGLMAHTFVSTAALPDLTHRQALALNLSGSAVANLVPFGGALGAGLNYAMIRSWGHAAASFGPFAALTTMWNVLVRLALPLLALALLVAHGGLPTPGLTVAASIAGAVLLLVVVAVGAALSNDRAAALLARLTQAMVTRGLRLVRSPRRVDCGNAVLELRQRTADLLRHGWGRMLAGTAGYAVLQALLLWMILAMLGSSLGVVAVFAGFAFGRLLTLVVLTPGGVGIAETGMAALLVALGGDPATVAAATLLFSALTVALEIPVGGVCGLLWWRRSVRVTA
jgi:uncharacterized membrane protein YbhN (UPF0104 family)